MRRLPAFLAPLILAPCLALAQPMGPYNPGILPTQVSGDATMTAAGAVTNSKFNGGTSFGSAAGKTAGASSGNVPVNGAGLSNNQPLWTNGSGQPITMNLAAPVRTSPSSWTGFTQASLEMAGYGSTVAFTPAGPNGRLLVMFVGACYNGTSGDKVNLQLYYGTGTAPAQAAATSGTNLGGVMTITSPNANGQELCSVSAPVTLTQGTAYWFDIAADVPAGTGNVIPSTFSVIELP